MMREFSSSKAALTLIAMAVLAACSGSTGEPGTQGPVGPTGPQGATGSQGPAGPTGPQGPQGDVGPTGPQGLQGDVGATGPQGDVGPTGLQGPQGLQGLQGLQGPQGDIGPQGPVGPIGPTGPQGPANLIGTQFSSDFGLERFANVPGPNPADPFSSVCWSEGPSSFIGTPVQFTVENLAQRVTVAGAVLPFRNSGSGSLFLDLCVRDHQNNVILSEGGHFGPLAADGTIVTIHRTFGEEFVLDPGVYSFGVCGCVAAEQATETWDAAQVNVTAQLLQQ